MATSRARRTDASPTLASMSVLDVALSDRVVRPPIDVLDPGSVAGGWLRVPTADAQRVLRAVSRLVADLPRDSSQDVVWTLGASELLVRTGRVSISLGSGLVTIGVPVQCDQVGEATISVPLSVGTTKQVRGLFAATFDRPLGPAIVTELWADALNAFAWECLITVAQQLAEASGKDGQGRALVPAAIAAEKGVLLVKPMARNEA